VIVTTIAAPASAVPKRGVGAEFRQNTGEPVGSGIREGAAAHATLRVAELSVVLDGND
jgi:hypothetical protein